MAVNEQIAEKIAKLLALAGNNPNEHEAALAASKAQALMQEYDLTLGDVESLKVDQRMGSGVVEHSRVTLRQKGKPGGWKVDLFIVVGQTSDCVVYASKGSSWYDGQGRYLGRERDVQMAEYLFEFLTRELERLQDEFGKTRWAELKAYAKQWGMSTHEAERDFSADGRHPLKSKQSWVEGAVEAVSSSLRQAKYERDANPSASALVVNKEAAIRDFQAQKAGFPTWDAYMASRKPIQTDVESKPFKPLTKRQREAQDRANQRYWDKQERDAERKHAARDHTAYRAGQDAGSRITLRPGVRGGEKTQEARLLD